MSQSQETVTPPARATHRSRPRDLVVMLVAILGAMTAVALPAAAQAPDIMKVTFEDTQVDPLLSAACGEEVTVGAELRVRVIAYQDESMRTTGTFRFTYADTDDNVLNEHIAWQDFTREVGGEVVETEHGVAFNIHHAGEKLQWAGTYELNWTTGELTMISSRSLPTFPDDYVEFICAAFA